MTGNGSEETVEHYLLHCPNYDKEREVPTASVVVEVAVNHEGPDKFINDCQAYFVANTSTTV